MPTTDNYVDGLVRSMAGPKISATPDRPPGKRRLVEMEDSEGEEETDCRFVLFTNRRQREGKL